MLTKTPYGVIMSKKSEVLLQKGEAMAVRQEEGCFCLNDKTIEDFSNTILREKRICRTTLHSVLCRARAFEFAFEKPFYEFEIPEILEMYRDVNSISVRSLQNMNLFFRHSSTTKDGPSL